MKAEDVPQDELDFKGKRDMHKLVYAVGKEGQYTGVTTAGWEPENLALRQAWEEVEADLQDTLRRIRTGELSPIAYFMEKSLMDAGLLASYVGKWRWTVKRHLKAGPFRKLSDETLAQYARVFKISPETLKHFNGEEPQANTP